MPGPKRKGAPSQRRQLLSVLIVVSVLLCVYLSLSVISSLWERADNFTQWDEDVHQWVKIPYRDVVMGRCEGAALAGFFFFLLLWAIKARRALCARLALRARACCANCSYDLTGNVSGVCPECGKKIASSPAAESTPAR
jgi:hypothetical protein